MTVKIHVEVFIAAQILARRQETFTAKELRREIEERFGDTRPGVQTHISAHCVANAPRNAPTVYNYLWRLEPGLLRPFELDRDNPHPSRVSPAAFPRIEDVPPAYMDLFF